MWYKEFHILQYICPCANDILSATVLGFRTFLCIFMSVIKQRNMATISHCLKLLVPNQPVGLFMFPESIRHILSIYTDVSFISNKLDSVPSQILTANDLSSIK